MMTFCKKRVFAVLSPSVGESLTPQRQNDPEPTQDKEDVLMRPCFI